MVLEGGACSSPEEALAMGTRAKAAVEWAGLRLNLGVDTGPIVTPDELVDLGTAGPDEVLDVHGLSVFEVRQGARGVSFVGSTSHLLATLPVKPFTIAIGEALAHASPLPEPTQVAIELFNLHLFEVSERARFLLLTTILEVLATRAVRPDSLVRLVDSFIAQAKSDPAAVVDAKALKRFLSGLKELRCDSITEAIRQLVGNAINRESEARFMGLPPGPFAVRCYRARSQLLHRGTAEVESLLRWRAQLSDLVRFVVWHQAGIQKDPSLPVSAGVATATLW